MKNCEKEKLEEISKESLYSYGVMQKATKHCFEILNRHIKGDKILELGPAEGVMTELLLATSKDITVVEGSELFCQNLKTRFPQARVIHSLFEEFKPAFLFDTIILGHVLEHVHDPVELLENVSSWLHTDGKIFAAVPNSRSIHRQAAVQMGILAEEWALNSRDLQHGHRRVFSPESFRAIFLKANLKIDFFGGYWLKPISNSQIESTWSEEMVDAFMNIGERYPDIAGEIYIVSSKG
jgi:2-polyprenyl-3-methyl-5-hydroxy-6-metoxy-1,4-benzoquinol methylase